MLRPALSCYSLGRHVACYQQGSTFEHHLAFFCCCTIALVRAAADRSCSNNAELAGFDFDSDDDFAIAASFCRNCTARLFASTCDVRLKIPMTPCH